MDVDSVTKYVSLIAATLGPILFVGAQWTLFNVLRNDVAEHKRLDALDFQRIRDESAAQFQRVYSEHNDFRDRLGRLEGTINANRA